MLNIGIVGSGGMGTVHISNYARIEGCQVAAVCDGREGAKKQAEEIGAAYYADIDEMLAREELDVVDICTPTFLHFEHTAKALRSGRHVICEKPLTLKSEHALELYDIAMERKRQLFVGQVVQFTPAVSVLRDLVRSGKYGKVLDAQFLRLSSAPFWATGGWLGDKNKSGLIPFDLHIHDLDLIVSLFGAPESHSFTRCGREQSAYPEHYRFTYEYPGFHISAEAAWYNAKIPFTATWRVYFENAVVINDGAGVTAYPCEGESVSFDVEEKLLIPTGINLPPTGMFFGELSFFLDRIRESPGAPPYRKEEILTVLRILEDIILEK